jgi:hypothetical protein
MHKKSKISTKILAVLLSIILAFGSVVPVYAAPDHNYATKDALRVLVRQIIEENYEDGSIVGDITGSVKEYLTDIVTDFVDELLSDANGLINLVIGLSGSSLDIVANGLLNDLIMNLVNSQLSDYGVAIPELNLPIAEYVVPILKTVIDYLFNLNILQDIKSRTIKYAVEDLVAIAFPTFGGSSAFMDSTTEKYTNDIYGWSNFVPLLFTTEMLADPARLAVFEISSGKRFDLVHPFHKVQRFNSGFLNLSLDYNITGWQNPSNAALGDFINLISGIFGSNFDANNLTSMDAYIKACLLVDTGSAAYDLITGGYKDVVDAMPSVVMNALKRAVKDVTKEYLLRYIVDIEELLAETINSILDKAFDGVFGADPIRNEIRIVPTNLQILNSLELIFDQLFDRVFSLLEPGNGFSSLDLSWNGILASLEKTGDKALEVTKNIAVSITTETWRVTQERLMYELQSALYKAKATFAKELNRIFDMELSYDMSLVEMKESVINTLKIRFNDAVDIEAAIRNLERLKTVGVLVDQYTSMDLAGVNEVIDAIIAALSALLFDANYSISLDMQNITFPSVYPGYGAQAAGKATVTNTGNMLTGDLNLALGGANPDAFVLNPSSSLSSIAINGAVSFTVTPKPGLAAGTYSAVVTVSNARVPAQSLTVGFTVNPIEIILAPSDIVFPDADPEYEMLDAQMAVIRNAGGAATGALDIALSGADADAFILSNTLQPSIAINSSGSFTITPRTALSGGRTYTAEVTV